MSLRPKTLPKPISKRKLNKTAKALPSGWTVEPFNPERDQAPEGHPDHDCNGVHEHPSDEEPDGHRPISGGQGSASDRGWGPGWPNCQSSQMATLVRADGLRIGLRHEYIPLVALLMDETERLGYDIKPGSTWGFACRAIRGSSTPSNHSWGLADDLNSDDNPMGPRTGAIRKHPSVIALWKRFGHRWGGDYTGRADDMHMEYMGTPATLAAHIKQAQAELGGSEGFLAGLTEKEQKQLLADVGQLKTDVDAIKTGIFSTDDAAVKKKTGRAASLFGYMHTLEAKLAKIIAKVGA